MAFYFEAIVNKIKTTKNYKSTKEKSAGNKHNNYRAKKDEEVTFKFAMCHVLSLKDVKKNIMASPRGFEPLLLE